VFSNGIKLHKLNKIYSINKIEKGEGNTYYSISNLSENCYIGYSENGFENLELKYIDSTIFKGNNFINTPRIPYSIKYYNDNVYIGYDRSFIVKFDKKLNPLDTFYLEDKFHIIDKIYIINNKIVVSSYSESQNLNYRVIHYLDSNKFIKINTPGEFNLSQGTPINVNYNNQLIFLNPSFHNGDSSLLVYKIYSYKDSGEDWDSISIKHPDTFISHLTEYNQNNYFCMGNWYKYPEKPQSERYVRVLVLKNQDTEKIIEVDSIIYFNGLGHIHSNNRYRFSYSKISLNLLLDDHENIKVINFKDYFKDTVKILNENIFELTEDKFLITGLSNQIIELDLNILTSVENEVATNPNFLIFPNPSSDKISVDLGEVIGIVGVADLSIYDILGNEIMIIPNYTNKSEIDVSNLSIGTFTIQIKTSTGNISQKLIVNR